MESYYSEVTKLFLGITLASVPPLLAKWFGRHLAKREAERLLYHNRIREEMRCQRELERATDYANSLEIALKRFCRRYRENAEIDRHDVDAIELEIEQRPKK